MPVAVGEGNDDGACADGSEETGEPESRRPIDAVATAKGYAARTTRGSGCCRRTSHEDTVARKSHGWCTRSKTIGSHDEAVGVIHRGARDV
jgi:hypothetical protein